MRFTIRPGGSSISAGGFSVIAYDAREALNHAKKMMENGAEDVSITDENGDRYDQAELERVTAEKEAQRPEG